MSPVGHSGPAGPAGPAGPDLNLGFRALPQGAEPEPPFWRNHCVLSFEPRPNRFHAQLSFDVISDTAGSRVARVELHSQYDTWWRWIVPIHRSRLEWTAISAEGVTLFNLEIDLSAWHGLRRAEIQLADEPIIEFSPAALSVTGSWNVIQAGFAIGTVRILFLSDGAEITVHDGVVATVKRHLAGWFGRSKIVLTTVPLRGEHHRVQFAVALGAAMLVSIVRRWIS